MKKLVIVATLCGAGILASAAQAKDLADLIQTEPRFSMVINKKLFDTERCLIQADTLTSPIIYRQPDIPGKVMMVYPHKVQNNGGVKAVVILEDINHTKVRFWGPGRYLRDIENCFQASLND